MRWRIVSTALLATLLLTVTVSAKPPFEVRLTANAFPGSDVLELQARAEPRANLAFLCPDEAKVRIIKDGIPLVVPYALLFDRCQAELEVPTALFARGNGQYAVEIETGEDVWSTLTSVRKTVNFVFPRPFVLEGEEMFRLDVAWGTQPGAPLASGVVTSGTLDIVVYFEQCRDTSPAPGLLPDLLPPPESCNHQHVVVMAESFEVEQAASAIFFFPYERLEFPGFERAPEGLYNVSATFHNREAFGNSNVPMDPTLSTEQPPINWFELRWNE